MQRVEALATAKAMLIAARANYAKQRDLEEVMSRLQTIPAKPLSTAQQALFALGYYHQRAHISAEIRERSAAKKAKAEAASQPTLPTERGDDAQ